jgi:predicted O-methyltransferase YrrM
MSQELWNDVDRYIAGLFVPPDPALDGALESATAAGLPPINVSASLGKLLQIFARILGARNILEIGTLAGYSTIWLARALPANGRLITLEVDSKHAEIAQRNFQRAGLDNIVQLRLGAALETLPKLQAEGCGPFDLIFIDADKPNNPEYFQWALRLSRPGSLVIIDNVVRNGAVIDAASSDRSIQGTRRLNELLATEPRVTATEIQTVGSKGYDGIAVAFVVGE